MQPKISRQRTPIFRFSYGISTTTSHFIAKDQNINLYPMPNETLLSPANQPQISSIPELSALQHKRCKILGYLNL
ncbi:hypothetical protein K0M31_002242 [Melipona bicolor]|uniref:Uncharacterized protein n=1 Tax=Melipona bicolor TaxID=60889 RepID=A0AA40KYP0_9HYME|nr:hypothetical protein K0M31_002242 [Melipona bicolor]